VSAGSVAATQLMPILAMTDSPLANDTVYQHGTSQQTHSSLC